MKLREILKGAIENPIRDLEDKAQWIEQICNEHTINCLVWSVGISNKKDLETDEAFSHIDFAKDSDQEIAKKLVEIYNNTNP